MRAARQRGLHRLQKTKTSAAVQVQWLRIGVVAAALGGATVALGHGVACAAPDDVSQAAGPRHTNSDHPPAGPQVAARGIPSASAEPSKSEATDQTTGRRSAPTSSKQVRVSELDPIHVSPNALAAQVTFPDPIAPQSTNPAVISSPVAAVDATTTPPVTSARVVTDVPSWMRSGRPRLPLPAAPVGLLLQAAWGLMGEVGSPSDSRRASAVASVTAPTATAVTPRITNTHAPAVAAASTGATQSADSTAGETAERKAAQAETNALIGWLPVSSTQLNGLNLAMDVKDFTSAVASDDVARMRADIGYVAMDVIGLIPYIGPALEVTAYQAAAHTTMPTYPVPVAEGGSTVNSSTQTSDLFAAMDTATPDKVTAQLVVGADGTKRMIVSMSGAREDSPADVLSGSVAEGVQGDNGWLNPVVGDFIDQTVSEWQPSQIMLVGFSNGGQQMENYAANGTYRNLVTNLVLFGAPITQNTNALPGIDSVDIVDSGDKATELLQFFEHYGNYNKTTTDDYAIFTTSAGANSTHSPATYQTDAQNFDDFAEGQLSTNPDIDYVRIWESMQQFDGAPSQSLSITTTSWV